MGLPVIQIILIGFSVGLFVSLIVRIYKKVLTMVDWANWKLK